MALAAIGLGFALVPKCLADAAPRGAVARPLSDASLSVPHALALPRRRRTEAETQLLALARAG